MTFDFNVLQRATRLSLAHMAEHLGVDRSQMYRYRQSLSFEKAEELAVAFGFVPENLWLEWREESNRRAGEMDEQDRAEFDRQRTLYRMRRRRYRERNPRVREYDRQVAARYYAECRDYVLKAKRRAYQENHEAELERMRRYREKNRQQINERQRARRAS